MSPEKEPNYFNRDLTFANGQMDEDAYHALFSDWTDETWGGEGSVWYLYSKEAAQRIAADSPDARIVILLRNPVDMAYAHHSQLLENGNQDIVDFERARVVGNSRKQGRHLPKRFHILETLYYDDVIQLTPQVDRFLTHFGRHRLHFILFDEFSRNPAKAVADCHKFLDVTPMEPDLAIRNPNMNVRNHRLNRMLRNRTVARLFKAVFPNDALYGSLHRNFSRLRRRMVVKPGKRAPMPPELRRELQRSVTPDVLRLGKLIDRDLGHWLQ